MTNLTTTVRTLTIGAIAVLGVSVTTGMPAEAQVDASKHWYTIFTNAATPAKGCSNVKLAYITTPNYSANYNVPTPYGYTKAKVNTYTKVTGSQGGWCPKSMSVIACEKREKDRAKYVWHNTLLTRTCATVYWNGTVLYSK